MLDDVERKKRLVRWWISTASCLAILALGAYLLVMRFVLGYNPLGTGYWPITGVVWAFGGLRLGGQLLRRRFLFAEDED